MQFLIDGLDDKLIVQKSKYGIWSKYSWQQMSYYRITTGLHLHYGDIIHLMRALSLLPVVVKTLVRLAGESATEIGPYYTEIGNNSLLFFARGDIS
jgi:hypothetical protein